MTGGLLNVAHTVPRSAVNGPGERFVLWVQGCSLKCAGCWNPDTWNRRPNKLVDPLELADEIIATEGIEGITITGGEPFEQAAELGPLVTRVRAAGLSVVIFTGFDVDELVSHPQRDLLACCDVVVAGRYRQGQRTLDLPWRGSENQSVLFRSGRYGPSALPETSQCEIHLGADGALTFTGFPPDSLMPEHGPALAAPVVQSRAPVRSADTLTGGPASPGAWVST
jgi:anaerobic ribonucleoside-triphosphate reductase activating protein